MSKHTHDFDTVEFLGVDDATCPAHRVDNILHDFAFKTYSQIVEECLSTWSELGVPLDTFTKANTHILVAELIASRLVELQDAVRPILMLYEMGA